MKIFRFMFLTAMFPVLAACPAFVRLDHLPQQPWEGLEAAVQSLRTRQQRIQTVSVIGSATLAQHNGEAVTLDLVGVADRAGRLRLQAMNAGGTVMDLTYTSGGLWVWSVTEKFDPLHFLPKGMDSHVFSSIWAMLGGISIPTPAAQAREVGNRFQISERIGPKKNHRFVIELDSATQAILRQWVQGPDGKTIFELFYRDHRLLDPNVVWPFEIRIGGEVGGITTRLHEVDLMPDPGDQAFIPPAGARYIKFQQSESAP